MVLFISESISTHTTSASIIVGINDFEAFCKTDNENELVLFTLIDSDLANGQPIDGDTNQNNYQVISCSNVDVVSNITGAIQLSHQIILEEISEADNHYIVGKLAHLFNINDSIGATTFFAFNTTELHNAHINNIIRTSAFLLFLLLAIVFIIRLFYHKILNSFLKFETNLEEKLHDRTKEIIDTNDELRQIFNSTANGIRIIDNNFIICRVNESFCRLSGIPESNLNGSKCYEIFPSVSCHTDICPLEQIKAGAPIVEQKDIRFKPGGSKIICDYKARPFLGKNGEFLGIIEDFKDITELENAENKTKQTQKQFEALMDSMPIGVFIRDFEGNMIYQNSYMDKAFGPFNFEKKNIKYVFPSSQVDRFLEEDKYVAKYGSFIVEEQLTDSNSTERTYVTHKFKFNGANNTALIGGVSIDISKRKQAEHNYYVLSKAIKNSPIGVLITSPEGLIEFLNPEFERISGKSNEELLGRTFHPFIEMEASPLKESIEDALKGKVFQEERSLKLYKTQPNWYSLSVAPVFNRNGTVAHIIFVFDDINQRKEYEKEIVIAKTNAEESDKLKTAFLSNLSHEIRTPLNAILGFSSLLNNSTITIEDKVDIPSQLVTHSNILLEIINDLIDISAIETNQLIVNKGECQLNQLLIKTFNEFVKTNGKRSLKTYIKPGVMEESFTILTDSARLSQVIRHLLSNALKFTDNGFVEFGYTFKDPGTLLFYVIDTGVGLDKDEQDFVFNPFRQADDSKTRTYSGLGLGLAISKNIIERLGGKIWVNSTKGEGSTFYFTLPYIPVRTKFDEVVFPEKENLSFNWSDKTIMVADDIDSNFRFIQTLLKPTGVNLLWAKNGKEAISIVEDNNIDLVLMDIVMPEMDGFEATKRIKQIKNHVTVICQTAYPSPENKMAGIECGMDKFLSKPIAVQSMMEIINDYISKN